MKKENVRTLLVAGSLLTVAGAVLLFFSVSFGTLIAEYQLAQAGGMDTGRYHIMMEGNINSFLAAGSILFGIGLVTILLSYVQMLRIEE